MSPQPITKETITSDSLSLLRALKESSRSGRPARLSDLKESLSLSTAMEFDSYFFFLRKFNYLLMERDGQVRITEEGDRVLRGDDRAFSQDLSDFFKDQISQYAEGLRGSGRSSERPKQLPPPVPDLDFHNKTPVSLPRAKKSSPAKPLRGESVISEVTAIPGPPPLPAAAPASSAAVVPSPAANAAPAAKGTDLDLRYTRFDPIGSGSLGVVYRGQNNALSLEVAIKELKDIFGYFSFLQRSEVIKRLRRELCAQAQVKHPCVLPVLDQNTDVARPYLVMELMQSSLRDLLNSVADQGLEANRALRIFLQIAYGLRAAHAKGLTHHNLKPENVLMDSSGNVKLADFGFSRVIETDAAKGLPQVFVGTGGMGYLAPELISKPKEASLSADIYALGILLYEMLTGQIPGRRSPLPSQAKPDLNPAIDAMFDKMTQDRPQGRYSDVDAVLLDFYKAFPAGDFMGQGDLILSSKGDDQA